MNFRLSVHINVMKCKFSILKLEKKNAYKILKSEWYFVIYNRILNHHHESSPPSFLLFPQRNRRLFSRYGVLANGAQKFSTFWSNR